MLKVTMMLRMSLEGSIVPTVPTCIPFMITGLRGQSGNISIIAINDRISIEEAVAFRKLKPSISSVIPTTARAPTFVSF